MCGIVGVAGDVTITPDRLLAMRDTLCHRGPDDAGAWWAEDRRVALAHRRLSIVDLSPAGRQPMTEPAGRLRLVCNGEIYNHPALRSELQSLGHRFVSRTDTEVVLAAYRQWGDACLSRFNGMFALAVYDADARTLLLARDRAGEKPLFFRTGGRAIAFASEIKALLADPHCPRTLDITSLDAYLACGYVPGDRTMIDGIGKLPPGHALTFDVDSGRTRRWAYWQLSSHDPDHGSEADLASELERLLESSVAMRLAADVPIGVMLSGGVDSSLVAALAARVAGRRLKTFTVTFPGHQRFDEAPFARAVADHLGSDHVELPLQPVSVEVLPELARQFDEPIADSSMVPTYLVSRLIRGHAKVALGGDGGDELFGGYPHHSWVQQQTKVSRWIPRSGRRVAALAVERMMPIGTRGRNYALGLACDPPLNIAQFNIVFDTATRARLLRPLGDASRRSAFGAEAYRASLCANGESPLRQSTALDFRTYLPDDILAKVDRASMLASLEVRAPFLDPRVIAFAFGRLPDALRATAQERKILPRRLLQRLLPPSIPFARKQGFSLPLQHWFNGDWGTFIEGVLTSREAGLFDRDTVAALLAGQRRGRANTHRLFALSMIELWRREYRIAVPR